MRLQAALPRSHAPSPNSALQSAWLTPRMARELATRQVDLYRDDEPADHGVAANVLDRPLNALRQLVALLAADPHNPPLAAGEIVTTGSLTRALPIAVGETWTTKPCGVALDGIRIEFVRQ